MAGIISHPGTPYTAPIPGGLHDGMKIHIKGTAEHHHNGFIVSLQNGTAINPRSETAFVFNPRFNENCVVRNSLQGSNWGGEERHGGFPFHKGQHFDITIHVTSSQYRVHVNNRHFCDFNHRLPIHMGTYLSIEEGIRIQQVRFEPAYPAATGYPGASAYPGPAGPIYNPPVPFVQNMPGGLYPNKMIYISGIPHQNPSRFNVNFDCSCDGDCAFVFDVRFNFGQDRGLFVCNNRQGGNWKHEERHSSYFPYAPDSFFDMMILVEGDRFKVAVNNQHLLEFFHRVQPLNRIDTLRIDGDVRLTQIRFQ